MLQMAPTSDREAARQVATRVSKETLEVLQLGLLLDDAETMQDLLRPVVEDYARRLAAEPEVQAMRRSARRYRDRKQGLSRLPSSSGTIGESAASAGTR